MIDPSHNPQSLTHIALSYPLAESTPHPDDIRPVKITADYRLDSGDASNVSCIHMPNHVGTHIDGPAHMVKNRGPLTDYMPPTGLILSDIVVCSLTSGDDHVITGDDLAAASPERTDGDILLIHTKFSRHRQSDLEKYADHNPGLAASAAEFIVKHYPNVKCVGIDTISIAAAADIPQGIAAHKILLGHSPPILLLEDINLEYDLTRLQRVWITPLFIEGLDSCPCTVVAELKADS